MSAKSSKKANSGESKDSFLFRCSGTNVFAMPMKYAGKFGVIQSVLTDSTMEAGEDYLEAMQPLDVECSTGTLSRIRTWLEHHEHDRETIGTGVILSGDVMMDDTVEGPTGWDKQFISNLGCQEFYELIVAAMDLDVGELNRLLLREMATRAKAPANELPKVLQIEDIIDYLSSP